MDATTHVDELEALLERMGKLGYLWHAFRVDQHGPEILAGVYRWPDCVDVVLMFAEGAACAYRVPRHPDVDVFDPRLVCWWYGGSDVAWTWVLRALITLARPGTPDAPTRLFAAPAGFGIPVENRRPVRVRRRGR